MDITDLKNPKEWQEILDRVSREFGIHTALMDADGNILLNGGSYNPLCARVRSNPESLAFVCSQTNRHMFHQVSKSKEPFDDFCELGMFKTVAPVFHDGRLLGGLTACGVIVEEEPLDEFVVEQTLGLGEEEAKRLVAEVTKVRSAEAERIGLRFEQLMKRNIKDVPQGLVKTA